MILKCHILPLLFLAYIGYGQEVSTIPTVFQTGQYEKEYESLVTSHPNMLLQASGDNMEKAYDLWVKMLKDIEEKAISSGYDIKGVKIWINVFWDPTGKINHIVYYPKPNSKNIDFEAFTIFLQEITPYIKIGLSSDNNFSHYGSAVFPVYSEQLSKEGN